MRQKEPALSYEKAFEMYFGKLSFTLVCSCGFKAPNIKACFKHIRATHGERIKKYKHGTN